MASQSDSFWSLLLYIFPYFLTYLLSVHGNSECYRVTNAYRRGSGQTVPDRFCVKDLSCIHSKDKIVISWTLTEITKNTVDFLIFLTYVTNVTNVHSVRINETEFLTVSNTESSTQMLNTSTTLPQIDIHTDYNVTVKRRYNPNQDKYAYASSTGCTKFSLTTITSKATNNSVKTQLATYSPVSTSQTTYRQGIPKQLTMVSYKTSSDNSPAPSSQRTSRLDTKHYATNSLFSTRHTTYRQVITKQPRRASDKTGSVYSPATFSQGTSRLVTKQHATNNLVSTNHTSYRKDYTKKLIKPFDKTGSNDSPARSGTLYTIIGLSVAGLVLLIVIVVIFVKLRKKRLYRNKNLRQKEKARTDLESNGPDGEDTYNHLSRDYLDRNTNMAKQNCNRKGNRADEEDTYSHMSRDYEDRQTKVAKQIYNLKDNKVNEEGIYNHLSHGYQEPNASMTQQGNEEDTYNHLSLSYHGGKTEAIDGNINVISVTVHAPTTLDGDDKNEKSQVKIDTINETGTAAANVVTESADDFSQQSSLADDNI